MFGYLILLLELAVLALIYWCVCAWKKPTYQVEGDPWGLYPRQRKCNSKVASMQDRRQLKMADAGRIKQRRSPIRVKQSRKHGWILSEKEKRALQEITGVYLEMTGSNFGKSQEDLESDS
jgi:hypothetical protein